MEKTLCMTVLRSCMEINVRHGKQRYCLSVDRKLSIIYDNSGTGKSNLTSLIENSFIDDSNVAISFSGCSRVRSLTAMTLEDTDFSAIPTTAFIVDEYVKLAHTKKFAQAIKDARHYFIIITRQLVEYKTLPYAVDSIYMLKIVKGTIVNVPYYSIPKSRMLKKVDVFKANDYVTEDSKSSQYLFRKLFGFINPATGNGSVVTSIINKIETSNNQILIMVDSAAFGPYISAVLKLMDVDSGKLALFLPESYEWLLLHLSMFDKDSTVQEALTYPDVLSDSYEQYFEGICKQAFSKFGIVYSKGTDNDKVLTDKNVAELASMFKGVVFPNTEV